MSLPPARSDPSDPSDPGPTDAEAMRRSVQRSTGVLDSAPEEGFDSLARCAATITGCPIALVSLTDVDRQWFKAAYGIGAAQIARRGSFCDLAVSRDRFLEVDDARSDVRFSGNELVLGPPHARFYAGAPLRLDDVALGTLCVVDTIPRQLDGVQREALLALAATVSELLRMRRQSTRAGAEHQRLLDFARASGDWLWEADAAGRITWIAGAFEVASDAEAPAWTVGSPLPDALLLDELGHESAPSGADSHRSGRRLHDLLRAGQPFARVLTDVPTRRGRLVVSQSAVPVHDEQGRLTGWRGTAREVTDEVALAARQRSQEILLQQVSAHVPGVIYQFRRDAQGRGRFEFINDCVTELFDLTPAQLMADSTLFYSVLHPDDRAAVTASILAKQIGSSPLQLEYRVVHRDGSERWVHSTASIQTGADGSTLWHGFVADITERKHIVLALRASDDRWALAADAAGIGMAQFDLDSGLIGFDARACANHGLPYPQTPFTVAEWLAAIHDDERPGVEAALQRALEVGGRFELRYRYRCADGRQTCLEVTARVERDGDGRPQSIIGTCRDVTAQMAVEALRHDKETAERASHAKTEFLSRVSHELRTPLNGILGFAQLMALDRHHPLAEEQQRRLDGVHRSGQHLLALINDVLEIARIEQQDFAVRPHPVDLIEALDSCLVMVEPLASERGVHVEGRLPALCWVFADGRAIEQVLVNLLSNAIKFNRQGGALRLGLAATAERVAISVEDEGPGLDAAQRAQLFQPFNRLGAERRRIEGNGLGLVIARELALAMGAELTLSSAAGGGCRFTLSLIAAHPPDDESPTVPSAFDAGEPGGSAPRQVLYIEDEPLNIVLMEEVFRQHAEWTLHTARDGEEGLELARALRPDLLLIDINLPDMSGTAVVQRLRADPATADLHCIALSADAMDEQVAAARQAGFDDYWTKPINVANLMRTMALTLERGRTPPAG